MGTISEVAGWAWNNPALAVLAIEVIAILLLQIATGMRWPMRMGMIELVFRQVSVFVFSAGVGAVSSLIPSITPEWIAASFLGALLAAWCFQRPWRW